MQPAHDLQTLLARPPAERRVGPFVLVEQLGRGSFAPVWLARETYGQTVLRTAALKLFAIGAAGERSEAVRARIVDEARALCRVEHPNVVRFYSLSMDETAGVAALAMEHVAGTSLEQLLAARRPLPVSETLTIGTAIASALAAVHRAALVHRDVKPANVVEAMGVYKLIDFGIAAADALREVDEELAWPRRSVSGVSVQPAHTTRGGVASGTVGYLDPECWGQGLVAEASSDLYALGAMLFECLTGRLPAATDSGDLQPDILGGQLPAPKLGSVAPDVPAALARVIDALLVPQRRGRPASAEWVALALDQVRRELAGIGRELPPEDIGPFRGLARYASTDRDVYFGRSTECASAIEVLRIRGLAALVGASGSGKSSLARAAILPAVADGVLGGWPPHWDILVAEPGKDPRAAIASALRDVVPSAIELEPEALVVAIADHAQQHERGVLLFIDQLEELATIAEPEGQAWAGSLLAHLARQPLPGVRTLVAARRDLLDALMGLEGLGAPLVHGSVLIEPLTERAWGLVLTQSLAAYGYRLEDDRLEAEVVAEIRLTGGAMPLVQFALAELWDKRDAEAKRVTRAGLRAIGGLSGALDRHADATLDELCAEAPGALDAARTVLRALTTAQGTRRTRTRADLERLVGDVAHDVVRALERARLVVADLDGVTLAHEALLVQWGRLRTWVAEAREDRMLAEELERDARRWLAEPDRVPLWRKHRLAFAESRLAKLDVATEVAPFVRASRRAERKIRWTIAAVFALAVASAMGGGIAYVRAVERQEAIAREALASERTSRESLEGRTRDVERAQARIDDLVRELDDSAEKREIQALQEEIRGRGTAAAPTRPLALAGAHAEAPTEPPPAATAQPAATHVAPASSVPTTKLQLEKTW